jgi:hypothetical protein
VTDEFELLKSLARPSLDATHAESARAAVERGVEWDDFLELSWRHGLMPLTNRHLLNSFAGALPESVLKKVREDFRHNAARNLLLTSELCAMLDALAACGVEALPLKGPALAVQVYGDAKLRSFVDLDLLVRPRDARRAGEALASLGYRPHLELNEAQEAMLSRSECDRVYLREGRNLMCELHWAVTPPYFSVPLSTDEIFADAAHVEMCGRAVAVPSDETLLLVLCVNGAKDLWMSLEHVCAVAELLRSRGNLKWGRVEGLAETSGARRMLLLGLHLARVLLDAPLPENLSAQIDADARVKMLAEEAVKRMARRDAGEPGAWEKTSFRVRARERRRDRARYCALRLFTPTYKDCAFNLPRPLAFVYYGVRLARLARATVRREAAGPVL